MCLLLIFKGVTALGHQLEDLWLSSSSLKLKDTSRLLPTSLITLISLLIFSYPILTPMLCWPLEDLIQFGHMAGFLLASLTIGFNDSCGLYFRTLQRWVFPVPCFEARKNSLQKRATFSCNNFPRTLVHSYDFATEGWRN